MKVYDIRILTLALAVWLVVQTSSLKAQVTYSSPFTITGSGGSFQFGIDGSFTATGTNGRKLLWAPSLGALCTGTSVASGSESTALGGGCLASGGISSAIGERTTASGLCTTAIGYFTTASGDGSTALGVYTTASAPVATALGRFTTASGQYSTAFGNLSTASGYGSTAAGINCLAAGYCSTAYGNNNSASGYFSTASGYSTAAAAMDSFVVGTCNVGGGSTNGWLATDPLFEVGNGSNSGYPSYTITPSDAFVVYKNGNATFQGQVSMAAGGDIPMYSGT